MDFLSIIKKITPKAKASIINDVAKYLEQYADSYGINTPLRIAHFLSQAAHESAGFQTLNEYGGDAYFNKMYDTRTDLGNTPQRDGDGAKYHGRGIFQLTGKANYQSYGKILGVDLVNNPDLAATPEISVRTALEYWKSKKLNDLADKDDIVAITKKINGGRNGLEDRQKYLEIAKEVLSLGDKKDDVLYVQTMLVSLKYKIVADGVFGPRTSAAISVFQKINGLKVTGQIDSVLIKKLEEQVG